MAQPPRNAIGRGKRSPLRPSAGPAGWRARFDRLRPTSLRRRSRPALVGPRKRKIPRLRSQTHPSRSFAAVSTAELIGPGRVSLFVRPRKARHCAVPTPFAPPSLPTSPRQGPTSGPDPWAALGLIAQRPRAFLGAHSLPAAADSVACPSVDVVVRAWV